MSAKNVLQQKAVSQSSQVHSLGLGWNRWWSPIKPVSGSVSDRVGASLFCAALLKSSRLLMYHHLWGALWTYSMFSVAQGVLPIYIAETQTGRLRQVLSRWDIASIYSRWAKLQEASSRSTPGNPPTVRTPRSTRNTQEVKISNAIPGMLGCYEKWHIQVLAIAWLLLMHCHAIIWQRLLVCS